METSIQKFKFEYENPNNIQSEVPGEQEMREDGSVEGYAASEVQDSYSPVITVTKKEEPINTEQMFNNPIFSEVMSEVITEPQEMRRVKEDNRSDVSQRNGNGHDAEIEDVKPKSKIPKFKETVSRLNRDRRKSDKRPAEEKEIKPIVRKLRRAPLQNNITKITKLPKPQVKTDNVNEVKLDNNDTTQEIVPVEEEFDKIYEEIIEKEHFEPTVTDTQLIIEKLEVDPGKVEDKFEEIVHDYEENSIGPLSLDTIDMTRSRIPVLRRRSEQEITIPKSYVRNLSLKHDVEGKKKNVKCNTEILKALTSKDTITKSPDQETPTNHIISKTETKSLTPSLTENSKEPLDIKNIVKKPSRTSIVDRVFNANRHTPKALSKNISNENTEIKKVEGALPGARNPIVSTSDISYKNNDDLKATEIAPQELTELVPKASTLLKNKQDNTMISEKNNTDYTEADTEVKSKESYHDTKLNSKEEIIIENNTVTYNVNNGESEIQISNFEKEMPTEEKITYEYEQNIIQTQVVQVIPIDNELASENNEVTNKIPHEEDLPFQGKVSRVISRLHSQEFADETPKPTNTCKVAKKSTMMSKIAMFEKTEPVPFNKQRSKILQSKIFAKQEPEPITTPRIIDEILKPQIREINNDYKIDRDLNEINSSDSDATFQKIRNANVDVKTALESDLKCDEIIFDDDSNQSKSPQPAHEFEVTESGIKNIETSTKTALTLSNDMTVSNKIVKEQEVDKVQVSDIPSVINYELYKQVKGNSDSERPFSYPNEGHKYKRTKSVVEIDLGDSINGKVSEIIKRISSNEHLDVDVFKKEVINIKERPRNKSVLEKIALFERKTTPFEKKVDKMAPKAKEVQTKPEETEAVISPEIKEKIAELANAKLKYEGTDTRTYIRLRDGTDIPVLFFGTALVNKALIGPLISAAIDMGYRGMDCAFLYGNEKIVGEAIRAKIQDGSVTREELYITSKMWSNSHRTDLVEKACRDSLDAMGLDYFDLYLIHYPVSFKEGGEPVPKIAKVVQYSIYDYLDAWRGMETLVAKGLVRSIGVSNFNSVQIARVVEKSKIKPVVNQVECHPYLNQARLEDFCSQYDIVLCSYGSLGSVGTPTNYRSPMESVLDDPVVIDIAKELNATPAQVLIRYQIDRGHVAIVKASSAARLSENLKSEHFKLSPAHLHKLNQLNRNKRYFEFKIFGETHKNYPFNIPF